MGYRVIFTVRADRDLEAAVSFLAQNSSEAAERSRTTAAVRDCYPIARRMSASSAVSNWLEVRSA